MSTILSLKLQNNGSHNLFYYFTISHAHCPVVELHAKASAHKYGNMDTNPGLRLSSNNCTLDIFGLTDNDKKKLLEL